MSETRLLDVENLDVAYANGAHALQGVSLFIRPGERVGILGANGAGKTTIARTTTGLAHSFRAHIRNGHVRFDGHDITRWPAWKVLRAGVVTIPEGRGIIGNMTVEDNLRLILAGMPRSRRPSLAEAFSMYPVLRDRKRSMAGLLSGGEQQMLAVARALLARPRLIVADELSLGLAPKIVKEILDSLSMRAANDGTAVLLIEQAAVLSLRFVDRAYILDQGRVVADGSSKDLRQMTDMTARYLGIADLSGSAEPRDGSAPESGSSVRGIVIDRVGLRFGGVVALRDVSLTHHADEVLGVIGPNGAGKTSLINCITGIYPPTSGTITANGKRLDRLSPQAIVAAGIARTFQHNQLCGALTVRENVMLGCHRRLGYGLALAALGIGPALRAEKRLWAEVEPILELLSLTERAGDRADSLPYGLQKRVEMARALALRPSTLLLDEPAAGTSDEDRLSLIQIIKLLRREHSCSVLLIEHDVGMVMQVSDRVAVLDWGECLTVDKPEVVAADERVLAAYLGVDEAEVEASHSGATRAEPPSVRGDP